jgi:hypothetical protein
VLQVRVQASRRQFNSITGDCRGSIQHPTSYQPSYRRAQEDVENLDPARNLFYKHALGVSCIVFVPYRQYGQLSKDGRGAVPSGTRDKDSALGQRGGPVHDWQEVTVTREATVIAGRRQQLARRDLGAAASLRPSPT